MGPNGERCWSCYFYERLAIIEDGESIEDAADRMSQDDTEEHAGICHRFPAQSVTLQHWNDKLALKAVYLQPTMAIDDWCGEFRIMARTRQPDTREKVPLNTPLAGFSVRARKAFARFGINTVGELLEKTEEDFLELKNTGPYTVKEISTKLEGMGFQFKKRDWNNFTY